VLIVAGLLWQKKLGQHKKNTKGKVGS